MIYLRKLSVCVILLGAMYAHAGPGLIERCKEDPLDHISQVFGRNAWAKKCGYISQKTEMSYNDEEDYVVFTSGKFNGNPNIPVDAASPCIAGLVRLGTCVRSGCYTPGQLVMFGGEFAPIASAFDLGLETVTALDINSKSSNLFYSEQPIESYVSGETEETIFRITTESLKKLEVTGNHPLIDKDGYLVRADAIRTGDSLLCAEVIPDRVASVEVIAYSGKVWNIQPTSVERVENIIVADGILTGSIRFQNEWAQERYRLSVRDEMDTAILAE